MIGGDFNVDFNRPSGPLGLLTAAMTDLNWWQLIIFLNQLLVSPMKETTDQHILGLTTFFVTPLFFLLSPLCTRSILGLTFQITIPLLPSLVSAAPLLPQCTQVILFHNSPKLPGIVPLETNSLTTALL